jgi:hypothetical protein
VAPWLKALLVTAAILLSSSAQSIPPHDLQGAFEYACSVMQYDCSEVSPPEIMWTDLYHTMGILGGYNGDAHIYMDIGVLRFADPVYTNSVLAHEITHYLDVQLGEVNFMQDPTALCQSEANGWRVGNAYLLDHGRPDLTDFGWFLRYGCFQ